MNRHDWIKAFRSVPRVPEAGARIGCAAIIGLIVFSLGVTFACLNPQTSRHPIEEGFIGGVIAFLAVLICMANDAGRNRAGWRAVQRELTRRPDISAEDFCRALPEFDPALLLEIREIVANHFEVAPEKIGPDDHLIEDYRHRDYVAGIPFLVAAAILESRGEPVGPSQFQIDARTSYRELVQELLTYLPETGSESD